VLSDGRVVFRSKEELERPKAEESPEEEE